MKAYPDIEHWVRYREAARIWHDSGFLDHYDRDPIIEKFRFCNVRREDDRGTIWVRDHIRKPFADHPNLWFMLCIARMINWPETLFDLMRVTNAWPKTDKFSLDAMEEVLTSRRVNKQKVWTGAYLIPSGPNKGEPREIHICRNVLAPLWEKRYRFESMLNVGFDNPSMVFNQPPYEDKTPLLIETVHTFLTEFKGFGPFIAYQACVDMRFTKILQDAPDRGRWAAAGPGTLRGLNRVYGRDVNFRLSQQQALEEMREIYAVVPERTGVPMDFSDVPNILCETDKYIRIKNGEGKMRARYIPGRGS